MAELIRQVVGRLTGRRMKNKHPITHIEGADNVMLDSSVLCCPVCYNVFSSVPSVLQCGHTFCMKCLRNIAIFKTVSHQMDGPTFPCPMCRQTCCLSNIAKNYLVEDILNRMEELPEEEEYRDKLAMANLRVAKQRLEQKCADLELSNNKLLVEMIERKKREMRNYIAIAVFILSYILLCTLNGN